MSRNHHGRPRPGDTSATQPPAASAGNVIDPGAPVEFAGFDGDDEGDDGGTGGATAASATEAAKAPATVRDARQPAARSDKRPATDVVLRIASEIATEARQRKLDTADALIAFHKFVVDRIQSIR